MSRPPSDRTKVVVRNLPPTLAAEAFQTTIDKHAEGTYNWLAYYPGKVSLKRTVFTRAFINFNSPDAVIDFKNKFDGHVFVSTRGTQYRCSVEYAMFQKVPTASPKKLAMEGTIEKDSDYQAFVKALEEGPKAVPTAQAQLEAQEAARSTEESGPVVTALMAFLQKKYESTPFTGRRGSKAARRREGAKLTSLLEEEADVSKSGKGRSKSSRSSRAAAEDDAATTAAAMAAASEAAAHAVKSSKHKHSKQASRQQDEQQDEAATKGRKHGKVAREATDAAKSVEDGKGRPAKADRHKHSRQTAAAAEGLSSPAASSTAAAREDDEEAKRAAAAALAAASAANAAAAARKSRVKAGHQVYTPGARAGGRLFAAALPKGPSAATAAADVAAGGDAGHAASGDVSAPAAAGASSSKRAAKPAAEESTNQAAGLAETRTSRRAGPGGKKSTTSTAAEPDVSASAGGAEASNRPLAAAAAGDSGTSSSRSSRGGRGRGRGGGAGGRQQPQQQIWLPKGGDAS